MLRSAHWLILCLTNLLQDQKMNRISRLILATIAAQTTSLSMPFKQGTAFWLSVPPAEQKSLAVVERG